MKMLQVRMGDADYEWLSGLAGEAGLSVSDFVRGKLREVAVFNKLSELGDGVGRLEKKLDTLIDGREELPLKQKPADKEYIMKPSPVNGDRFAGLSPYKATELMLGPIPKANPDCQYSFEELAAIDKKIDNWWKVFNRINEGEKPEDVERDVGAQLE